MVSSEPRFRLRLESGERAGEMVSIPAGGLTVGRRPDNALCLNEPSVSGRHARLVADDGGVMLEDLGSTNGTRIGSASVEQQRLAHGDQVVFGKVRATFLDSDLSEAAPVSEPTEEVHRVTSDRVASAGRRSFLGLVVLLVVLAAGAGATLFLLNSGESEIAGVSARPVIEVPGNLFEDPSFEDVEGALSWTSADAAPEVFYRDSSFRSSGAWGLGVELGAGDWARSVSQTVSLRPRRAHALVASLAADGGVTACLGFEFLAGDGSQAPFICWTDTIGGTQGFQPMQLIAPSLSGYDQGRVVFEARGAGDGSASLDDLSLVATDATPPAASLQDHTVYLIGEPARTAVVLRNSDAVVAGMRLREPAPAEGLPRWSAGSLSLDANETGMRFAFGDMLEGAELTFAARAGSRDGGGEPFIATTGDAGFRGHSAGFEDVSASGLLLGEGMRMMRAGFGDDVVMNGAQSGGALHVLVDLGGAESMDLQLSFRSEREEAARVAAAARSATRDREVGEALAQWSHLLDEFPYEAALVTEAEKQHGLLLQRGLEDLAAMRDEFERARFFGLADLFRQCGDRAAALGLRYAGSEVEAEATALVDLIAEELNGFDFDSRAFDLARLKAILGVVESEQWSGIAEHMRGALEGGGL